jgi:hypothetical protein
VRLHPRVAAVLTSADINQGAPLVAGGRALREKALSPGALRIAVRHETLPSFLNERKANRMNHILSLKLIQQLFLHSFSSFSILFHSHISLFLFAFS